MSHSNERTTESPSPPPLQKGAADDSPSGHRFPIVGVGASAGGLEALSLLLSNLPDNTGMAFLVVQHLDPRHESRLSQLLARVAHIPVVEADQGQAIQPNTAYVIPPNTSMTVSGEALHLRPRSEAPGPHLPIDVLFRSLAEARQERAIGIVLSGTGADGTQGLCEIKAAGGITFAQDENSATHAGMPRSAAASGYVDFVLPPDEIGRRLSRIGDHPYLAPPPAAVTEPTAEESYRRILRAVRQATDVDFSQYRDSTIKRRIMRRMALHTQRSLAEYVDRLQSDPSEVQALAQDLLINVTSFFRNPEIFETLKERVFPRLIQQKSAMDAIRVWVPGCSTGQEAYSLAMTLVEFLDHQPFHPTIQIFGTDLDQRVIDKARMAQYPEGIEGELSAERLARFFHRGDHSYRITRSIRDMCVFARHNVTTDPPFSHVDLVSCRNVMIYLTAPLQQRVLSAFHYALNTPGFLVLGTAETVGDHTDLFELREPGFRIYARKPTPPRSHFFFPRADPPGGLPLVIRRPGSASPTTQDYQREADRILLSRYAPPAVLLDENFNIIQYRGGTSAYLEQPAGEPTTNVLRMAREGLFLELRNALDEVRKRRQPVRRERVQLRHNGGTREIALEVIPVRAREAGPCYLVLFQEAPHPEGTGPKPGTPPAQSDRPALDEARQVRQELAATREYLQSMIEQQDAVNEELRSANEEVLSSNEELQSTNEELETAKEELQSANEELTTVNEQLQRRNRDLDRANSDLTNLLASTDIPVIMVGPDLHIRWVTPAAQRAMGLLPADVGRPISDLRLAILVPDLEPLIAGVIEQARQAEREVRDREGRWFILRFHPYRTADDRVDGAVIVLLDVDQIRRDQETYRRQAALIELSQDAIIVRNARNEVQFWNRGAREMYGWTADEARGKELGQLVGSDRQAWATLNAELERTGTWEGELQQLRRDGSPITVHSREVLVRDERGTPSAILSIKRDITEFRHMVEALKEADRRKDEFLALLAHELRNPLAPLRNSIEVMRLAGNDPAAIEKTREILDRQVKQLAHIVEDLIDVTRIVEKKIALQTERVLLSQVLETAVETCRSMLHQADDQLMIDLPQDPLYLDADPVRLAQVVINLLQNAIKFTPPGGRIWITAQRVPAELTRASGEPSTDDVVLRVRDNGVGIPSRLLPHIFEMFVQGERPGLQGRSGLGVGLTLAQSLVHMHGGRIEAHSAGPDQGSEFVVRLPLAGEAPPTEQPTDGRRPRAAASTKRILVVDDNPDQVESLGLLLRVMGHEVSLAADGPQALRLAHDFAPDVVLVDIGLPGMSGYEVARRLREQPEFRNTLLVAQTGWSQENHRYRSQKAGFDYHLVKPVTREALEEVLNRKD